MKVVRQPWAKVRPAGGTARPETTRATGDWIRNLTVLVAIGSTACALVGFGVTWGYTSVYGLAPGVWYDNGFELIGLAGDALLGLLFAFTDGGTWRSVPKAALLYGLVGAGVVFIWWSLLKPIESRQTDPNFTDRRAPGVWLRALQWLGQRRVGWPGHLLRGLVAALVGGTVTAVSTVVGTFMIFLALVMISLLPYIGYVGGAAYANATVMAPQRCVSSPSKRLHVRSMGAPGANCVEVVDPVSKQKYVGRLVAATGTKIVLYLPSVDQVIAIPRKTEVLITTESAPSAGAAVRN